MTASKANSAPAASQARETGAIPRSAVTVSSLASIQIHDGQLAAPDTTSIKADIPVAAGLPLQGSPMAENNPDVILARIAEPGPVAWRRMVGRLLGGEFQATILGNKPHTREVVGDHAPAVHALQVIPPALRVIAIHFAKIIFDIRPPQNGFQFLCQ